ncbi:glucan phosphoethanolaminetransferase (alkaline phosphatase superfamily) [Rossellomorea marisflavi]
MENEKLDKRSLQAVSLTAVLLVASIIVFPVAKLVKADLWLPITLFAIVDAGFVFALILGVKSNRRFVKVFSLLANGTFIVATSFMIYLLLIANGISEP